MRFRTWNIRSLHKSGSLETAARKLARYKLGLVGVQEVRWDKGGPVREEVICLSMEKETTSSIGNRIYSTPEKSISS